MGKLVCRVADLETSDTKRAEVVEKLEEEIKIAEQKQKDAEKMSTKATEKTAQVSSLFSYHLEASNCYVCIYNVIFDNTLACISPQKIYFGRLSKAFTSDFF